MAHDFSSVTSTTNAVGGHVASARSGAGSVHDHEIKAVLEQLVEATGGLADAINFLVDALKA
jgi:hypothetical protein